MIELLRFITLIRNADHLVKALLVTNHNELLTLTVDLLLI